MGRRLSLPLVVALLLIAGCGDDGDGNGASIARVSGITRQIAGNWVGELRQKGLAPFEMAVGIEPDGTGQVAYTDIRCGGSWVLSGVRESVPPQYLFTEDIEEGAGEACKGSGDVSVIPKPTRSPVGITYRFLRYRFSGGGVTSRGLLHRTKVTGLTPLFKQAGVSPP